MRDDVGGVFQGDCVCDIVEFIDDLQDVVEDVSCPTNCLNPVLGDVFNQQPRANTRPFILFTEDGKPFKAFFKSLDTECDHDGDNHHNHNHHGINTDFEACKSPFFRVESVNDCCAVLRVLEPQDDYCDIMACPQDNLRVTNSCITVDLRCFCAIQCLDDIYLRGV
ncbi:CotY/CotZ family spore coat protein [Cytobacillus sp. S13-E01]|uniref:CotY/CotZ family spore coat protein n=1 Tax=Cytobacillus sp. S13-E01 TaxID=3031326 RepID=UPI0023D84C52|nr:CotY/CotZ family spore coat protein [Cytobacillus sp. S13-E01]MDF0727945.1 CotY/CotZ family spore coat protein [Cytobacillus sp. S13-E01]